MASLVAQARRFGVILQESRKRAASADFKWYPYNSLSNVQHLEALMGSAHGYIMEAAGKDRILDVGCADGDLAFFFESLGYNVTCIDHPASNQNDIQGLKALHRELRSAITIREIDVDSEFPVGGKYGLTFCLGLLYHLKNPFFVLHHLARISRFCVLSTRIARRLPGGAPMPKGHPLAYLLAEDELNLDDTNCWIFSEPGLRRLLERTRWEVVEFFTTGDTVSSDPSSLDHDERAFCLLKSHYGGQHLDLLDGWHHVEESGWRWTQRQFAARATNRTGVRYSRIEIRVFAPPLMIEKFGSLTLRAEIDQAEVQPFVMRDPGIHKCMRRIPKPAEVTSVVFRLDNALEPAAPDFRELGIIVLSLEFV